MKKQLTTPKAANAYGCVAGKVCNCPRSFSQCSLYWSYMTQEEIDQAAKSAQR